MALKLLADVRRFTRQAIDCARYYGLRMLSTISNGPLRGHRELDKNEFAWRDGGLFLARITNGEVFSDYGVILKDRILISDLSPMMGAGTVKRHEAMNRTELGVLTRIPGKVAVISSHAHQRYFHWMIDVLPRLEILRQSGVLYDHLIANSELPYQRETLDALGVASVINPKCHQRIAANELIVPSLAGELGVPSRYSVDFLRKSFGTIAKPYRKIYISRGDALTRRIANEKELLAALRGFEVILLDGMSVADQAQLFAEAEVVIGPHGAGFTNAVFMHPTSRVIEFMPETYFNPCFEVIAMHVGLEYRRIGCKSLGAPNHDMVVNLRNL